MKGAEIYHECQLMSCQQRIVITGHEVDLQFEDNLKNQEGHFQDCILPELIRPWSSLSLVKLVVATCGLN